METNEWLVPGTKVAELGSGGHYPHATMTTIERLTKTQVVLANGSRYRLDRLQRSTGTWNPTLYLKPADDPAVQRALRIARAQSMSYRIEALSRQLRDNPEDLSPLLEIARLSSSWTRTE